MGYARSALRARGDYRRMRGDPGFLSAIGGVARRIAGTAARLGVPGAGGVHAALSAVAPGRQPGTFVGVRGPMGIQVGYERTLAPQQQTVTVNTPSGPKTVKLGKRRRRMNVTNDKALRRAIRRQAGFVKLARRALQGTGYTIVSRSSRVRRGPRTIVESGPGSVVTK